MKKQSTISITKNAIILALIAISLGIGCKEKSPVPVPTKFGYIVGDTQEAPARSPLPSDIILIFTEAKGVENTDEILLDYTVIMGNGKVTKSKDTVVLLKSLNAKVGWTLGDFGEQQMLINGKWKSNNTNVEGFPLVVKAKTTIVNDADNNSYNTVLIGEQVWMAENLKTTKYADNSAITLITDNSEWANTASKQTAAYCWIENDKNKYKDPFGAGYNFYAVATNKLCPVGWHVPNETEFQKLVDYAGGESTAAGKLKEAGIKNWLEENPGTNDYLFGAVPGGYRTVSPGGLGTWANVNYTSMFWTSTLSVNNEPIRYFTEFLGISMQHNDSQRGDKGLGINVRCLKD